MELDLQNPRVIGAVGNSNFAPVFMVISSYGKCSRMSQFTTCFMQTQIEHLLCLRPADRTLTEQSPLSPNPHGAKSWAKNRAFRMLKDVGRGTRNVVGRRPSESSPERGSTKEA